MDAKRTAVVTGATSGLGEAAAFALATLSQRAFRVIVVGRDKDRGSDVVARIRASGGEGEFVSADLLTVAGVKDAASAIRRSAPQIELLINNAGGTFGEKQRTADRLERTFALNVMAPFALTQSLVPQLSAAKGRVVNVVTGIPKGAKTTLDELSGERASAGVGSYTRNKLALDALTKEQQRRFEKDGITVMSLHPGIIPGTRFGEHLPAFLRGIGGIVARVFGLASTLDQAAQRYVALGTGEVFPGAFYNQGNRAASPAQAEDRAFASALWDNLESIVRSCAPAPERAAATASHGAPVAPREQNERV